MPIVEIETSLGVWERKEVTYQERREILKASDPLQRFMEDGIVYIAHPLNLWTMLTGDRSRFGAI